MSRITVANALLDALKGNGWCTTDYLLNKLGKQGQRPAILKYMHSLQKAGLVDRKGVGKFRWNLIKGDWNRDNPWKTNGDGIKASFEHECPACGKTIFVGDTIVKNQNGKWVHKNCLAAEVKALDDAMAQLAEPKTDEHLLKLYRKLSDRVAQLEAEQPPREIIIHKPNAEPVKIEGIIHPVFEQVLFHINCGDNVMLVGPKGCGKTHLAEQLAAALELPHGMISLSGGVTEGKLFGRVTPNITTGKQEYNRPLFVELFEEGGLFLLDEVDAADPNVLLSINSGLANGLLPIDRPLEPVAKRAKDFVCLAAANTWGNGADRQYVGRNQQDSAFTERFVQIAMDYDQELERHLCPGADELLERLWGYRKRINDNRLERSLSTRFILRAYNWLKNGKDLPYVDEMLFGGWRADEVKKAKGLY